MATFAQKKPVSCRTKVGRGEEGGGAQADEQYEGKQVSAKVCIHSYPQSDLENNYAKVISGFR